MKGQYGEWYFDEPTNAIRYRLRDGDTKRVIYDGYARIPFTTREHADRIIAQLNIAIRGEA